VTLPLVGCTSRARAACTRHALPAVLYMVGSLQPLSDATLGRHVLHAAGPDKHECIKPIPLINLGFCMKNCPDQLPKADPP